MTRGRPQRADPAHASDLGERATLSLAHDHERLWALLVAAADSLEAGRPKTARRRFRAFREAFERHVRVEEEVLFPLFEVRVGLVGGPTVLMRDEHRQMADRVQTMAQAVETADQTAFASARKAFSETFRRHTAKEERFLYTTLERLLSSPQRAALGERLLRA
jgi:hemerythrin-like domain-containing protein